MIKTAIFTTFMLLLLVFIVFSFVNAPPHKFNFMKGDCTKCHINYERPLRFTNNISSLCNECHETNETLSHVVGIKPTMYIPYPFTVDENGELTCSSCHDIHMPATDEITGEKTFLLRSDLRKQGFCDSCHTDTLSLLLPANTTPHAKLISQAHFGYYSEQATQVDNASQNCVNCHDGTMGTNVHIALDERGVTSGNHPIGKKYIYSYANGRGKSLKYVADIEPEIKLIKGKVGCLSCHDPFNLKEYKLVIDNKGGSLCFGCHNL